MYYRRRIMMTLSHTLRTLRGMTAWVSSASQSVTALLATAAGRLHAARDSKTEGGGQVSFMVQQVINARGESDSKSDSVAQAAVPIKGSHRGDHRSSRAAAKGKIYRAIYTDTEPTEYATRRDAARGIMYPAEYAGAEKAVFDISLDVSGLLAVRLAWPNVDPADHVTMPEAAGFEANKHAFLSGHEAEYKTTLEAAGADAVSPQEVAHQGAVSSGLDASEVATPQAVTDMFAVAHSGTIRQADMDTATPGELVQPSAKAETVAVADLFMWFAPKMVDGALYIRSVHEIPDQPDSDNTIHII